MALYEDDTQQTPWDKELSRYTGGPGESIGTITNETTGESTTVNRTLPVQPMTQGQPNQTGAPQTGDLKQFMDWVIKNQIGFNPYTMNPTTEALNTWNQNESDYFNKAFAGTGMSPGSMTPEGLRHWNEQKREGMAALFQEARDKQNTAVKYLDQFKDMWEDENTIAHWVNTPGGQVAVNKFGKMIKNPNAGVATQQNSGQMVAGPGAPSGNATQQNAGGQPTAPGQGGGLSGEFITQPNKPKEKNYQIKETPEGYVGINPNDPNDIIKYNVAKPLTAEQQNTLKQMIIINKLVREIKDEFIDNDKGWGKDSYKDMTGVQGVTGWLRTRIGGDSALQPNYSEREAAFRAKVAQLYTIVYGFSGKQINGTEIEKLKPFIPEVTDSDLDFKGKLNEVLKTSQSHLNTTLEIAKKSGMGYGAEKGPRTFVDQDKNSPTYGRKKIVYPDGREELR